MKFSFQKRRCFLFFKTVADNALTADGGRPVREKESVLLKCGSFAFHLQEAEDKNEFECIAVHLYPDMLTELGCNEIVLLDKNLDMPQKGGIIFPQQLISKFIESLELYFKCPHLARNDVMKLKIRELILVLTQQKQ